MKDVIHGDGKSCMGCGGPIDLNGFCAKCHQSKSISLSELETMAQSVAVSFSSTNHKQHRLASRIIALIRDADKSGYERRAEEDKTDANNDGQV